MMDRAPSATGQGTAQESLLASTNRLATVLSELLPVASAHLGRRDGVTTGSVRLSSHSIQQELEEAGPIFQEVVDGLRSRTAGQRMSLYDRCAASADNGAEESGSSDDRRDYGEGGGGMDEGGCGMDEDGGATDDGGDASVGKAAEAGSVGKAAEAGSVGKAAKPSTHDAARFDSTDTPFQKHASLFARRAYVSVGFQKSLLLETDALCDDCNVFAPGVLDYCRSPSGDRLCYQCDVARHEFVPCWRERWVLVRVGDDCSNAALRAKSETPAETGCQSPSSGSDSVSGTERSASAPNSLPQCALRQLLPTEFVEAPRRHLGPVTDESWIATRVFPAPTRGVCPKCHSCHCQPAIWNGDVYQAKDVFELGRSWYAGDVSSFLCRTCKHVFGRLESPADSIAVGYTSVTPCNVHSIMNTAVLNVAVNRSMHGSSHQSDEELRETMGHGQFCVLEAADHARVPLQSLREVHRVYRTFTAFPDAILRGFVYHCIVCGSSVRRGIGDGCLKCWRNSIAGKDGSNVVYALPNPVVLPATRTAPALLALRVDEAKSSHGSCGDARLKAAAERSSRQTLDQHGMYAVACSHLCGQVAIEMGEPESISGHVTLALLLSFMLGVLFFGCDVTCIARRHVAACGKKHADIGGKLIGPALLALCGTRRAGGDALDADGIAPVDASSASASVASSDGGESIAVAPNDSEKLDDLIKSAILSVKGDFATFVLKLAENVDVDWHDSASSGAPARPSAPACPAAPARPRAPAHPSEYDLAHFVVRLWNRIQRGELTLEAAVPEFHAYIHACRRYLSRIPGAGAGHEVSEWLNALVLSRLAPFGRMLTSENWRLFFNSALALHNHRKSLDAAYELLALYVRATLKLQLRDEEFKRLKAKYLQVSPRGNVTDAYLAVQSSQARRLAASRDTVPVAATDNYMNQLVRLNRIALVAGTLSTIRAELESFADDADKRAVAIVLVADSGLNLPSVSSVEELDERIATYTAACDRLRQAMPDTRPVGSDSAIEMYFINLHALAADVAVHNWKINEHRATHGGKNTTSEALFAARKITVVKLARCLASLKRLTPHSPQADVRNWRVPDVDTIYGPESLPSCLGTISVTSGDSLFIRVIEAFDKRRAAREELNFVTEDIFERVSDNIEAVVSQLSVMLDALTRSTPDIGVGAGASGLWGGMQGALFDFSTLQPAVTPVQERQLAAGMACRVAEGLRMWRQQQAHVTLLQAGLRALRLREYGYALLRKDATSRALAMRHGRAMFAGHLSPEDWAALAEGNPVVPRRRSPVIRVTSRAVADLALPPPADDVYGSRGTETEESGQLDADGDVDGRVVDEADADDDTADQSSDAEYELDRICRAVLSDPAFQPGSTKRRAVEKS